MMGHEGGNTLRQSVWPAAAGKYDLEIRSGSHVPSSCLVRSYLLGLARRPDVSLPRSLSLSPFSFLSTACVALVFPSHSFSRQGRPGWEGSGCDPITGRLQQSPSADWFYNPHSGSQAVRESGGREEEPLSASHVRTHAKNYITLLDSASMPLFLAEKILQKCVRECATGEL